MNVSIKFFTHFFTNKAKQILVLVSIVILYFFISRLPYLNLFFSGSVIVFSFLITLLFTFKPTEKNTVIFAFIITVVAVIASWLSFHEALEAYGNTIFILLFYIFFCYIRNIRNNSDS